MKESKKYYPSFLNLNLHIHQTASFFLAIVYFTTFSSASLAGYDESRKYVQKARGEGAPLSDMSRPNSEIVEIPSQDLTTWNAPISIEAEEDQDYLSEAGGLDDKWQNLARGEQVADILEGETEAPLRWDDLDLSYENDSANPEMVQGVSRNRKQPGWHVGSAFEWEEAEPGSNQLREMDAIHKEVQWDKGLTNWKVMSGKDKRRPIRGI